jgi:hypothetical protein
MATAVSHRRSLVRLGLPDKLFPSLIPFFMVLDLLIGKGASGWGFP